MNRKNTFLFVALVISWIPQVQGQTPTYPESMVDQSYIPPSPNAQSFQSYGNEPVALYEGVPAINIPIYGLKCGSLSLPISLSYNYNGLYPLQDASWVGLGWNLSAGGSISRIIEGGVDNSENSGFNYGQYNLLDSIQTSPDLNNFLQSAYNNDLGYSGNSYDMAPDIFDAEFNGFSGKFFWYNNKAYLLSYNKELGVSWLSPTSNITITTAEGVVYTFGAKETTTYYLYGGPDSTKVSYTSAWCLTMIVSPDRKDTIQLNYAKYGWQQSPVSYQTSYTLSTGSQQDLGSDPTSFNVNPSDSTEILQSITCRSTRVSFIPDPISRTDIVGNIPRLKEIDVVDSLTGNTVKKNQFSYEYFGQTSTNPAGYERLALKRFNSVNLQLANDSLTYTFKYVNEFGAFPLKGTAGVDYWGYYNGAYNNSNLLPPPDTIYFSPKPPSNANFSSGVNRTPSSAYSSYGILDTLVYPAGGYTAFQYQQNNYYSKSLGGLLPGPGLCLSGSTTISNNPTSPASLQKSYNYLLDDGVTCSGIVTNIPNYSGPPFVLINEGVTGNYNFYKASTNSDGIGGINPKFYYQKVSESITDNGETHLSAHYFTSYPGLFLDVRQTKSVDYINNVNTNIFTPVKVVTSTYNATSDTNFNYATAFIDSENVNAANTPKISYKFSYTDSYWNTYWVRPVSQQTTQYDVNGDSITTTLNFFFNNTTRNIAYTQQGISDGETITEKFKYPEDYSSSLTSSMVAVRVISPVIESETWLKKDVNDSTLISGKVTVFDQGIYKPITTYTIEATSPIASLNNQTISGGLYTSLLCDSRYIMKGQIQYDGNNNPSLLTKASDINNSIIWDYKHCQPIAQVKNAVQADIAYTSFEADGSGNWTFTGRDSVLSGSPTGNNCYNLGQTSGTITKSGLTSTTTYVVSYWTTSSSSLSITGTIAGYPIKGKTIGSWTYYEHKITGQTTITLNGSGVLLIDEVRLYPANAQMNTFTYASLIGISSQCDPDNKITYYQYDGFGRLKVVLDQDHNIIKTVQYHYNGETAE
jgi:YD repeat-containing protein